MSWKKFSPLIYVVIVALFLPDAYAGRLQKFDNYLDQLESVSGSQIHPIVRSHLTKGYKNKNFGDEVLSAKALQEKHQDFSSRKRTLIKQWETATGRSWPKYTAKTECVTKGTCITKRQGHKYDAHHIVPQSHGGPNAWWNLIPLDVRQHNLIHGMPVKTKDGSYIALRNPYCCDKELFPNSCVGSRGTH
ncbi:MAG: HNH endonuclease [Proteobacteria bacterium]|nr:HNH endonuclease [Pseudomonadota bacterium]